VFHYDCGLFLTQAQLGVDVRRRQPRCFVSHAHADHIARHELALATPATAMLYRHRLGARHRVWEMPYREPIEFGGLRLTTYPAGHCLGSAMLLADDGERSVLYTGDFKLDVPVTAEPAELPHADILIMESTFGLPCYRLPPREEVVAQLLEIVAAALADGKTPVIHAYTLGKSQEVTKLLTMHGIPVLQHPDIYAISQIYQSCGVDLGDVGLYVPPSRSGRGRDLVRLPSGERLGEGHFAQRDRAAKSPSPSPSLQGRGIPYAIVTLPRGAIGFRLAGLKNTVSIAPTGWAMDPSTKYRLGVDWALPLSDHADFDQLIEAVRRVEPREIYCTHGPDEFVGHLRDLGFNAFSLNPPPQRRLF
jgi:putative mRNA 3-end processing factor